VDKQWFLDSFYADGTEVAFAVNKLPCRIGRGKENDLVIADLGLSRIHATLIRDISGQLRLVDENSTNGTFVNRIRIEGSCLLKENDIVHLANAEFKLRARDIEIANIDAFDEANTRIMPANMLLSEHFASHETELDELICGNGLSGAAQPIVDARTRRCVAYELLGRANHPQLPTTPIELFSLAASLNRETDLSLAFREFGLSTIAPRLTGYPLFINTHPKEAFSDDFLTSLERLRCSSPQLDIVVEIHESMVTDTDKLREFTRHLARLGIRFAYDDFGAGQARLVEIADLPVHFVKFDMALIRGLHQASERKRRVVGDLVHLVLSVDAVPLAEGVETEEEARACVDMGFQLIQGFLTGRPIPANML